MRHAAQRHNLTDFEYQHRMPSCLLPLQFCLVREDRASSYVAYRMLFWSTLKRSSLDVSLDHSATLHTLDGAFGSSQIKAAAWTFLSPSVCEAHGIGHTSTEHQH